MRTYRPCTIANGTQLLLASARETGDASGAGSKGWERQLGEIRRFRKVGAWSDSKAQRRSRCAIVCNRLSHLEDFADDGRLCRLRIVSAEAVASA